MLKIVKKLDKKTYAFAKNKLRGIDIDKDTFSAEFGVLTFMFKKHKKSFIMLDKVELWDRGRVFVLPVDTLIDG